MRVFRMAFSVLLALFSVNALAIQVQVVGLFPGAVVLNVDGQRKLVRVGQSGPGGVTVVNADNRGALLRIDDRERFYELSRDYGQAAPATGRERLSIARSAGGHYRQAGSINGRSVQFLVDTGATSVAMNEIQGQRLGLDYRRKGQPLLVATASGKVKAWKLQANSVKIGGIEVLGVDTVVIEGTAPDEILLGMSFLSQVRWGEENGMLTLEAKF
ncbi:retropepsin-like aspartic protease family protein [Azomonas macrocytogenes]|uniref:retropepsin-like aspartic protease family protein n=1 Tax=Azomonas macrocytogenes TaxID=69962 RepID=UPI001FE6A86B|nr:TIGR02281 family clan AA aspartic protease [Azomonas macrocytogenes]